MINRIIILSGPISSGKSTLAKGLDQRFHMTILKTSKVLQRQIKSEFAGDRKVLQAEGERLDKRNRGRWVLDELIKLISQDPSITEIVIDSVRIEEQIFSRGKVKRAEQSACEPDSQRGLHGSPEKKFFSDAGAPCEDTYLKRSQIPKQFF